MPPGRKLLSEFWSPPREGALDAGCGFRGIGYTKSVLKATTIQLKTKVYMTQTSPNHEKKALPPAAPLPQTDSLGIRVPQEQIDRSLKMALAAVKAAAENRGQDIILIDLTDQTSLFDFFVIATGSSRRQLAAMSTEIDRVLKYDFHELKLSVAGYEESRWIVLDYGSIVVHLFDEETREFYDLESLWADGKQVDISGIIDAASAQMARLTDSSNS